MKMGGLARISHQAAQDTVKALVLGRNTWMIKNTVCFSNVPITVHTLKGVRALYLM